MKTKKKKKPVGNAVILKKIIAKLEPLDQVIENLTRDSVDIKIDGGYPVNTKMCAVLREIRDTLWCSKAILKDLDAGSKK